MKKEIWSKGKNGGTVITDTLDGLLENSGHTGADAVKYYGGALVCESIYREKDIALISAAPDLLEALQLVLVHATTLINENHPDYKKAMSAISKATDIS